MNSQSAGHASQSYRSNMPSLVFGSDSGGQREEFGQRNRVGFIDYPAWDSDKQPQRLTQRIPHPPPLQCLVLHRPIHQLNSQFKPTKDKPIFKSIICKIQHPLIALTYIVETLNPTLIERFFCVLCDKKGNPQNIVQHLISQTHRMNYLNRHFPRLILILNSSRPFKEDREFRERVLINIAKVLEERFGRASAFICAGKDYKANKETIFEKVKCRKHITQDDIRDESVLLEGITLEDSDWEASHPPQAPIIIENEDRKQHITQKVLDDYHMELRGAIVDLDRKRIDYERNPESHPFYKKEWTLFWNRKYDEVTARGGDPKSFNFKGEWLRFFMVRIQELYREEVNWKTEQLRRKFNLTVADLEEPNPERQHLDNERKRRISDDEKDEDTPKITKKQKIDQSFVKPQKSTKQTAALITTLRVLSSLETELGLLAPRVLDLLSKALSFERQTGKSSNHLLFDSENLNLIEMVREKILGMQMVKLLASNKVAVAGRAIDEIENLLEIHEALAKVRASLQEMGKEDASPEEIETMMTMIKKK